MTSNRPITCLVALWLGALALPACAQTADPPAAKHGPARKKGRAAARPPVKPAAAPALAGRSPLLGPDGAGAGEDRASSLERRRKAFFAPKPDEGGDAKDPAPPAGVTLGGSNGLTPGMGFKF